MKTNIIPTILLITLPLSSCQHPLTTHSPSPVACQQLTGQWQGSFQDTTGLFGIKDQHITLNIQYSKGLIKGTSTSPDKVAGAAISGVFSGQCHNGTLTNIYLYNQQRCGHYAPRGKVNTTKITLYLPYENAMTQTDFKITATRVNRHPEEIMLKKPIKQLISCH